MKLLTKKQMEALPTKRLLAYKATLMKAHSTPNRTEGWRKCSPGCVKDCCMSKQNPAWLGCYEDLKAILANRDHVDKK